MRGFNYFLSNNFFISFCAVALVWQTNMLLNKSGTYFDYCLIFSSTLAAYNFYVLVSRWFSQNDSGLFSFLFKQVHILALILIAGTSLVYTLFQLPENLWIVLICTALTCIYTIAEIPRKNIPGLKKMGFLKAGLLALTWSMATVLIPANGLLHLLFYKVLLIFIIRLLGLLMICLIFELRDIHVDKINLLRAIIDINPQWIQRIMLGLLFLYAVSSVFFGVIYADYSQMFALLTAGLAAYLLYIFSLKKKGYFFYYFLVDGWMIFTAFLTYLATI
jgi:hypothetical protein